MNRLKKKKVRNFHASLITHYATELRQHFLRSICYIARLDTEGADPRIKYNTRSSSIMN